LQAELAAAAETMANDNVLLTGEVMSLRERAKLAQTHSAALEERVRKLQVPNARCVLAGHHALVARVVIVPLLCPPCYRRSRSSRRRRRLVSLRGLCAKGASRIARRRLHQ
jgi:hypothetical protein